MENDNKNDRLSFEKFNKITKKDLYKIYFDNCNHINSQSNIIGEYKRQFISQSDTINIQSNCIIKQKDELKICRIIIWILLIIIFMLSITLVVF